MVLAGDVAVAGEVRKHFAERVEGFVDGPDGGERAKVARAVVVHAAREEHFGERLLPRHFDVGIALVVLEADVEMRLVFLDEVAFEDEGFQFRFGDDELDIADALDKAHGFVIGLVGRVEIRPDAAAQVDGFADVNDLVAFILHQVNAGTHRQGVEFLLDFSLRFEFHRGQLYHK